MKKTICVCGAGTMGSGIAQVAAQSGYTTILFDVSSDMLHKAEASIRGSLKMLEQKGKIEDGQAETIAALIRFTSDINDCRAHVIIEAIVEKLDAKLDLFTKLSAINGVETIYATNTSSLPVTNIAIATKDHTRVAGMHFFNPAPVMKLVEVVTGRDTSAEVINELVEIAKQMGKTPVVCKDAPGFIVNRVARHYYLEALRLVEQNQAEMETIDKVLEAAGFKMGPFKLMDMIGLDINFGVSNIVWKALGEPQRLTPSPVQKAKVDAGELGKKTGKGFYNYS
jgi:3-hydroxybutyryl-CoA dehydrogenase